MSIATKEVLLILMGVILGVLIALASVAHDHHRHPVVAASEAGYSGVVLIQESGETDYSFLSQNEKALEAVKGSKNYERYKYAFAGAAIHAVARGCSLQSIKNNGGFYPSHKFKSEGWYYADCFRPFEVACYRLFVNPASTGSKIWHEYKRACYG